MLTGFAGIITATAGLIVALDQAGILSEKKSELEPPLNRFPAEDISPDTSKSSISNEVQDNIEAPVNSAVAEDISRKVSESSAFSEVQDSIEASVNSAITEDPSLKASESSAFREVQAIIDDPDGYTNVRSGPGTQHEIIARVFEGEVFYTAPQPDDWWPVRTKDNKLGYMHISRIEVQN
ncbi:MAG: SH3 domain-containing protein [Cyanothece sp. SIO1E1]|nr:SH3 domain-containing protein [Cyanothece sp. SIO1E1]